MYGKFRVGKSINLNVFNAVCLNQHVEHEAGVVLLVTFRLRHVLRVFDVQGGNPVRLQEAAPDAVAQERCERLGTVGGGRAVDVKLG